MMDWKDRVVVVTGVGRAGQVGDAVARAFVDAGARVAIITRTADEARDRGESLGSSVLALHADLSNAAQVDAARDGARERFGKRAHALVCVAGGFAMSGPIADADPDVLARQIAINLTTAFVTTRSFVPMLRGGGSIVYFASAAALPDASPAKMSAYAASKSGVLAVMRAVAAEERANGVRANAIAPTSIRTGTNVASMGDNAAYVEMDDVTRTVMYLCSDESRAVTGQTLRLA